MAGEPLRAPETHSHQGTHSTFGMPNGKVRPQTQDFIKKRSGKMGSNELPESKFSFKPVHSFKYKAEEAKRPAIPRFTEKPIMGLKSNTNYVKNNIVENVTAVPRALKTETDWRQKRNYGAVPKYLEKAKERIQQEYEYLRQVHQDEEVARGQNK